MTETVNPFARTRRPKPPQDGTHHVYTSLQAGEMRTFLLHPGQDHEPLVATFECRPMRGRSLDERATRWGTIQLDKVPPETLRTPDGYDAISYAWGEPRRSHKLYVDSSGEIDITESLFGALKIFRSTKKYRRLWADAICINQADSDEKAAQVAAMHLIYKGADLVLVWLGPEVQGDGLAFSLLNYYDIRDSMRLGLGLHDDDILAQLDGKLEGTSSCPCCERNIQVPETGPAKAGLLAVAGLLSRPWVHRLWVVQEVDHQATIGRIFSGSHSAPISNFIMCLLFLEDSLRDNRLETTTKAARATTNTIAQIVHEYSGHEPTTVSFWNSFASFSRRLCSDPRDRIYAIRNCLGLDYLEGLRPDYSVKPQEIFRRLTCAMMQESNFQAVDFYFENNAKKRAPWIPLSLVGTETKHADAPAMEPSWVCDLHHLTDRSRDKLATMTVAFAEDRELYHSSYLRFECKIDLEDQHRIQLRGRCFATLDTPVIRTAWPALETKDLSRAGEDYAVVSHIVDWYRQCKDASLPALAGRGNDAVPLFHDLLICKNDFMGVSPTHDGLLVEELLKTWPLAQRASIRPHVERLLHYYNRAYLDKGRLLCIVRGSHHDDVAWVPVDAKAGDRVCIVGGAPVPYVVRPCNDGSCKLLGDAFTASGSLADALGVEKTYTGERPMYDDARMSWRTDDAEMLRLMDQMGWLTLS